MCFLILFVFESDERSIRLKFKKMSAEKGAQQQSERDHTWARSWPKSFIGMIGTIQILLSLVEKTIFYFVKYSIEYHFS